MIILYLWGFQLLFLLFHILFCLVGSSLWVSLAKVLSILFLSFQKNSLLVSLIFSLVSMVYVLFIASLIFIISFLLLAVCLFCLPKNQVLALLILFSTLFLLLNSVLNYIVHSAFFFFFTFQVRIWILAKIVLWHPPPLFTNKG